MTVRMVQITEEEAKAVLSWSTGPERKGMEPTEIETSLSSKMRTVIASFYADRTLSHDEV